MATPIVLVELVRHFERGGRVLAPGARVAVPIDEAQALFRTGFAKPIGASRDWNVAPFSAWVTAWRRD